MAAKATAILTPAGNLSQVGEFLHEILGCHSAIKEFGPVKSLSAGNERIHEVHRRLETSPGVSLKQSQRS